MSRGSLVLLALVVLGGVLLFFRVTRSGTTTTPSLASTSTPGSTSDPGPPATPGAPTSSAPSTVAAPSPSGAEKSREDRAQRDEIRRRIYQAFGEPAPEPPSAPHQATAAEERDIDHDYIVRHIREDFVPMGRQCYGAASEKNPELEGRLVMTLRVVGDEKVGGIVESTEIEDGGTLRDPEMFDCLRNSMESLAMPPPKQGGSFTVKVPMGFSHHPPDAGSP
jgi:hypothetical protein